MSPVVQCALSTGWWFAGAAITTRLMYRRGLSRPTSPAGRLVIVVRVVVNRAKEFDNRLLPVASHILFQGRGYRFLLRAVVAHLPRLLDEAVVNREICWQHRLSHV